MKITITGNTGEGKSTIAKYIEECLADVGIAVELDDEELSLEWHATNEDRLEELHDRELVVEVKTINLMAPIVPKGWKLVPIED